MSTVTIVDGIGLVSKKPGDIKVYEFDFDTDNLATAVTIVTSTFTITAIAPSTDTALTKDTPTIEAGSRKTQIRLTGGTLGAEYEITNSVVTNETPTQTKVKSFRLRIE